MVVIKRIISVLVICLMVAGCTLTAFASDRQNPSISKEEVFVLRSLGVFDSQFDEKAAYVTRGEMAMLTIRFLGISSTAFGTSEFVDVNSQTQYAPYIQTAKSLGIMNGGGSEFMPQRFVSGQEAVKTVVSSLGYDVVAASKGGYPSGYMICASELGILDGVNALGTDAIETADLIHVLYNALDAKPLEVKYSSNEEYAKGNLTQREILEDRFDLEYFEGILYSAGKYAIKDDASKEEGYVQIGDKVLKAEKANSYSEFLAYPVLAYADKKGNLVDFCVDDENLEKSVFSIDEIDNISLAQLSFFDQNGKEEKLSFNSDTAFIYNGVPLSEPTNEDVEIFDGSITTINNDEDKAIEAVFIEESVSLVVDEIYLPNTSIYFKSPFEYAGRSSLRFNFDDEDYEYTIQNNDGTPADFSSIQPKTAITLVQSKDGYITKAYLSSQTVSGVLEEIDAQNKKVVIDKKAYELALSEEGSPWLNASLGKSSTYLIDYKGRVVCESEDAQGESYGFVSAMSSPSGMKQPKIQLVTSGKSVREEKASGNSIIVSYKYQNGELMELEFASRLKFNNSTVTPTDISSEALLNKLIKYKLDSDGKLKSIDTFEAYSERSSMKFNADIISFGGRADRDSFLAGSSTKVLCIPNYADSKGDWEQTVKCTDDGSYTVYGADIDPETGIAGAVAIYADMDADTLVPIDDDTKISMVASVSQVMDEDGDAVYDVHILTGSEESHIKTGDSVSAKEAVSALRPGDLIRYSTDVDGRIANLELYASIQDLDRFYRANANSTNEEIYGRVTLVEVGKLSRIKNEFVDKITVATNEWLSNGVSYELVREDGPVMYICNPKAKTVRSATGRDMLGSDQFGVAESSKVFMLIKNNDPQVVVVIE